MGAAITPHRVGTSARSEEAASQQVVGFHLAGEEYGIEITKIQEIILPGEITRIPQVPHFIEGLINLRGSVIPIIDLRKRFNLPSSERTDQTRIVVVNVGEKTIGVVVDAVTQVIRINRNQIEPTPPTVSAAGNEHIAGLAKVEHRMLILLEIDKLLRGSVPDRQEQNA
ncbi:chemotaxis protein CheW [bacterium]|nr:chemotaxis protein CheW [bacterium]